MEGSFEGVYLKHQKNGENLCSIAGRAGETWFVQVITNGSSGSTTGAGFCFGRRAGGRAAWRAGRGALRPAVAAQDGHHRAVPLLPMQCSHSVYSMAHTLAGGFTVDGRFIDLTGGTDTLRATGAAPSTGLPVGTVQRFCAAVQRDGLWSRISRSADAPLQGASVLLCTAAVNTGWPPTGACASWRRRSAGLCCGRAGICWKRPSLAQGGTSALRAP